MSLIRKFLTARRIAVLLGATGLFVAAAVLRARSRRTTPDEQPLPSTPTGVTGEGMAARTSAADGPPLAPAPIETPGPSVTPPATPESDVERAERADAARPDPESEAPPTSDALVAQEEAAAAAEAAAIGGRVPHDSDDPAMDPVYQAGGGEQDGWEEAEAELIENATHGDGRGNPERDAFTPELEADRSTALYAETDRIPSTEVVEDPSAGPDDPGEGPGLAADRGPSRQPRSE